jgi:hypothetical protein
MALAMTGKSKTENFNDFVQDCAKVTPFQTQNKESKNIAFIGKIIQDNLLTYGPRESTPQWAKLDKKLFNTWRCVLCRDRIKNYKCYIDIDGMVACRSDIVVDKHITSATETITQINTYMKTTYQRTLWTLVPVTQELVHPEVVGISDEGEEFKHFHLKYDSITDDTVNTDMLTKAFWRYVPIIITLLLKISPGLIDTLKAFRKILCVETYAKVLIPGTDWLLMVCDIMKKEFCKMSLSEKMQIIGEIICKSNIVEDDNDDVVITAFHQASKSVLVLLETGTLSGLEKMKMELATKWGDPSKYQRRTRETTVKMAQIAMNKLKDFTNTIHTTAEIETHPDTVTIKPKPVVTSSMDAFAKMGKKKPHNKYDFLSTQSKKSAFVNPCNIRELLEKIKSGEIYNLKISTDSLKPCYTAKTDLERDNLIYDHLWLYLNNESATSRFGYGNKLVTHIKHIKTHQHNNIMFIIKNSRLTPKITSNCCLPEFLSTKCKRSAGTAFEELNKSLPINTPEGDLSIGLGTSISNMNGLLLLSAKVYINDSKTPVTITHY